MSQLKRQKLERINAQIIKLEHEKKILKENIKQDIVNLLDDRLLLNSDFETLIGGVLSIQKVLLNANDTSQKQMDLWKKEGIQYCQKNKKTTSNVKKMKDS